MFVTDAVECAAKGREYKKNPSQTFFKSNYRRRAAANRFSEREYYREMIYYLYLYLQPALLACFYSVAPILTSGFRNICAVAKKKKLLLKKTEYITLQNTSSMYEFAVHAISGTNGEIFHIYCMRIVLHVKRELSNFFFFLSDD